MSTSLRLISFLILSIAAAFAINAFGFGIAHSMALGLAAFFLSPGILVNVLYYEAIHRAPRWMRREKR